MAKKQEQSPAPEQLEETPTPAVEEEPPAGTPLTEEELAAVTAAEATPETAPEPEAPAPAPVDSPAAPLAPPAPKVLEAPATITPGTVEEVGARAVLGADETRTGRILDHATGATPDLEGLFLPVGVGGQVTTCTRRLIREVIAQPYSRSTQVVLLAAGAQVPARLAAELTATITAQAADEDLAVAVAVADTAE